MSDRPEPLLSAVGLVRELPVRAWWQRGRTGVLAVDGLDLEVHEREVVAVTGVAGSGRTTLGRLLSGDLSPSGGRVLVDGQALADAPSGSVVLLPLPTAARLPRRATAGALLFPADGSLSRAALVAQLAERVGVTPDLLDRRIDHLASDERRAVLVALALGALPRLVVLDGETDVDPGLRAGIQGALGLLREQVGTAVVVLAAAGEPMPQADRLVVLDSGRIVEDGAPGDLARQALHPLSDRLLSGPRDATGPAAGTPGRAEQAPTGCAYRDRCALAQDVCASARPRLERPLGASHRVACHFPLHLRVPDPTGPGRVIVLPDAEPTAWEFARD